MVWSRRSSSVCSWNGLESGTESPGSSRSSSPPLPGTGAPGISGTYVPLIERIYQRIEANDVPFFSLEFFPPRTKAGAINLISRFDRMRAGGPLFCDITWHPSGDPGGECETSSMTIAGVALNYCGLQTMLHITCINLTEESLHLYLERAKVLGIRNILALRGDSTSTDITEHRFKYATDLVQYVREQHGDYFTIGVAGYPSGHPECVSYKEDLRHLKEKVEAGADFIITQLFFDANAFIQFVKDCRQLDITIPILAGVMPIQSYDSLRHIVQLSKCEVPSHVTEAIKPISGNDEAIRNFGIHVAVDICCKLMEANVTPGLHFYTLNREVATITILKQLGLWSRSPHKTLPWPAAANHKRCLEDVRPIFWSSRPKSYVYRTQTWDEFPNGRWGNSASPAFGELREYYLFIGKSKSSKEELLGMWGKDLTCEEDIWSVFYCYLSGEPNRYGRQVTKIPWNDDELSPETSLISDKLMDFNRRGVLTINSQPNVNGVESADPVHGWGMPGGYVYQKAYLEFFTCRENVFALKQVLKKFPLVNYHILSSSGGEESSNSPKHSPIAVTWGVFPGREIVQPTVVDPDSFRVWKDEAFSIWKEQWAKLYPENSFSANLLSYVSDNYYLVNLVDNQYPKECCLWQILDEMFEVRKIKEDEAKTKAAPK